MISSILKKLIQRSRLDEYKAILNLAKQEDYIITSLIDWYENDFYEGQKVFILRHDVDYDNEGAFKMFKIEQSLGVKSTFYYRETTFEKKSMREIHKAGFEVSFHFETLATYCRKRKIKDGTKLTEGDFENAYQQLVEEINEFEANFWKVRTICSHGDQRNRLIGIPNHVLLKGKNLSELGIYFETYDEEIKSKFNTYISDASIKSNHAWRYGVSPEEAIMEGKESICLLTHPQHWNYHFLRNISKVITDITEYLYER